MTNVFLKLDSNKRGGIVDATVTSGLRSVK
jgi:hypothetical protein